MVSNTILESGSENGKATYRASGSVIISFRARNLNSTSSRFCRGGSRSLFLLVDLQFQLQSLAGRMIFSHFPIQDHLHPYQFLHLKRKTRVKGRDISFYRCLSYSLTNIIWVFLVGKLPVKLLVKQAAD